MTLLPAAATYAAAVFAAGFLLGAIRVLAIAPLIGELKAVVLELPVMLAISYVAAAWSVGRHSVPATATARARMGAIALILLMAAELALGIWGFGQPPADIARAMARAPGLAGLVGQAGFALMPLLLLARSGALR